MYALFAAIPLIGHLNPLLAQAGELRRRGHRVAVAVFDDLREHVERSDASLPIVDLGPLGAAAETLRAAEASACRNPDFARGTLEMFRALNAVWTPLYDGLMSSFAANRPDVLVADIYSGSALCAADAAGVPLVVNNPGLLGGIPVSMLPPADNLPFMFSRRSIRDVGWGQRLAAPFLRRFAALAANMTVGRDLNRLRAARGLPPTTVDRLLRGRTILVNSAFGLEYRRPLPSCVHMVGAMVAPPFPPLPPEMSEWLASGPPVVYANLGTLATASDAQLAALLDALSDERYRALWILREPQAARLPRQAPASVRIMPWGPPPAAILAHPNVRLFLSHCGVNSINESMIAGTPIVGIPMFVDQSDWAVRVADAGVGLWLDKTRFDAAQVRGAILRVLEDGSFTANVPAVQRALAAAGGVGRAAELIERVATTRSALDVVADGGSAL